MIPTPDHETLSAFYIRADRSGIKKRNTTILMFHGNAGNIGHRIPIAKRLIGSLGCNVLMLEYRGYGLSTGSPDQDGLMVDAQTGYDYLRSRAETRDHDIIVYGQSLGGAVSIQLVSKNQNDPKLVGLILENTFLSIRKLIPSYVFDRAPNLKTKLTETRIMPPAKYLAMFCHQVWPSDNIIPSITEVPILFLSGLQDEIVPYVFRPFKSHACIALFPSCNKTISWQPIDHPTCVVSTSSARRQRRYGEPSQAETTIPALRKKAILKPSTTSSLISRLSAWRHFGSQERIRNCEVAF